MQRENDVCSASREWQLE